MQIAKRGFAASDSGADAFIHRFLLTTGAVHWVHSESGDDGNPGSEAEPLATLAQAITNATANNGDIVVVKEGHQEILSASITVDKPGLRIFGIGNGASAPRFTVAAAIVGISIEAEDVELNNLYFPAGITVANSGRVAVDAAGCLLKNLRFDCGQYDEDSLRILDDADYFHGESLSFSALAPGPETGVKIEDVVPGFSLSRCTFDGGSAKFKEGGIFCASALINYRIDSATLANAAGIAFTDGSNRGVIGNLHADDASQVQL